MYFSSSTLVSSKLRRPCSTPEVTSSWGPYLQQISEPFEHGEEPTWDDRTQLLYFVDIHRGLVNSFNPVNSEINSVHLGMFPIYFFKLICAFFPLKKCLNLYLFMFILFFSQARIILYI